MTYPGRFLSTLCTWTLKATARFRALLVVPAILLVALSVLPSVSRADNPRQTVVVGYTPLQPPFAVDESGNGLIQDVLAALNRASTAYHFVQKRLYAGRAITAFTTSGYDLIAFQNRNWGFEGEGVTQSLALMKDRGAYFTSLDKRVEQGGRQLLGATRGFRYGFADFSLEKLEALPNVLLAVNEQDVVKLVVHGRVHMGVASLSLLRWYQHASQKLGAAIKILPKSDYSYDRSFVISPTSPVRPATLNAILLKLQARGELARIFAVYGLTPPPLTPDSGVVRDWGAGG